MQCLQSISNDFCKSTIFDLKRHLRSHDEVVEAHRPSIDINTGLKFTTAFVESIKNDKSSPKALLKFISNLRIEDNHKFLPFSIDMHALEILLSINISLNFKSSYDDSQGLWKAVQVDGCSQSKTVWYPAKLRPMLLKRSRPNMASVQEMALVFQNTQFRFVSCHKEQLDWKYRLKELVVAFDLATWALIIISCNLVSLFIALEYLHDTQSSIQIFNNWFPLFTSLRDQSSSLFQRRSKNPYCLFGHSYA